jgi:two-component system, cell cycle response regulator DivK
MSAFAAAREPDDSTPEPRRFQPPRTRTAEEPSMPLSDRAGVVLIVDDSSDARELYGVYLSHQGFSVVLAADGASAVNTAIRLQPDLVVMDLSMPYLDGIAATQHLKAHPRTHNIPVILLTGYPSRAIERGALEGGVDVFLTKPCLPEDLERHVRGLLKQSS